MVLTHFISPAEKHLYNGTQFEVTEQRSCCFFFVQEQISYILGIDLRNL